MPEDVLESGFKMSLFKAGVPVRVHGECNSVCGFITDATPTKLTVKSFADNTILLSCEITVDDVLEELVRIEVLALDA